MQKKPLATDLTVQTSDYEAVKLGTDKIKATMVAMKIEDKGAVFDKHATKEFEKNGSFGINTSDYDMTEYSKCPDGCCVHLLSWLQSMPFAALG